MPKRAAESIAEQEYRPGLLFVDDDPLIVESLSLALAPDYQVYTAASRKQVRELLQQLDEIPPLALIDLGLPPLPHSPEQGFELIHELIAFNSHIKILVLSGQNETGNIQHALTLGAVDFVSKPCDVSLLKARLAHQVMMLDAELAEAETVTRGELLLGDSPALDTLRALISQYAETPFPVLVQGVNDFIVFGTNAAASLSAGLIYHWYGWQTIAYAVVLPLMAVFAMALWLRLKRRAAERARA